MQTNPSLWLLFLVLFPLLGSALNGLLLRSRSAKGAGIVASVAAGLAFLCAVVLFARLQGGDVSEWKAPWLHVGALAIDWHFRFDALASLLALVVSGVGLVIHVYSIGYMAEDETPYRYFAYLNLFLAAMLVLVLAANLPVLFVGWEGVGFCSYLLIGYWYDKDENAKAGLKAFVMNRIGDAAFLLGVFLCFDLFGTLDFQALAALTARPETAAIPAGKLLLALLCFLFGAAGKSAQIPLYTWLPDAMAGPTPVSALIHAATMVTAGVYLLCRLHFLLVLSPDGAFIVSLVGGATALLAAAIATSQTDIKKVLAYSTVSQLGLLFLALGSLQFVPALFHLFTHAFFKALLFLGAGSVIHALHGEQDLFRMGGLRHKLPLTFATFAVGWAAICGLPPFSGFFSKDLLLFGLLEGPHGLLLWTLGSATSFLTAFYMTRLFLLTFFGPARGSELVHGKAHESPLVMTVPLVILAVGATFAGLVQMPAEWHLLPPKLGPFLALNVPVASPEGHHAAAISETVAMLIATGAGLLAIALAWTVYGRKTPTGSAGVLEPLRRVCERKFYVDEAYDAVFVRPYSHASAFLGRVLDTRGFGALGKAPAAVVEQAAAALSALQLGAAQFYLLVMALGALGFLWAFLHPLLLP